MSARSPRRYETRALAATLAGVLGLAAWAVHLTLPRGATGERVPAGREPADTPRRVSVAALGRLEPKDGVIRIAGPSRPAVVIAGLLVDEGDRVEPGQVIATLDSLEEDAARVARLRAELDNAGAELERYERLHREGVASVSLRDTVRLRADVAKAELQAAQAALDRASVRAPVAGQILRIHARSGERVGPNGIVELGQTDQMQRCTRPTSARSAWASVPW